jgi:hypothetical protein
MREDIEYALGQWLLERNCSVEICGSQVTCVPPPEDSDTDYLVLIKRRIPDDDPFASEEDYADALASIGEVSDVILNLTSAFGFVLEGGGHYQELAASSFASLRRGRLNLIITSSPAFARRHRAATHVCRLLNVAEKQHRIAIFQAVLYGNQYVPKALGPEPEGFRHV